VNSYQKRATGSEKATAAIGLFPSLAGYELVDVVVADVGEGLATEVVLWWIKDLVFFMYVWNF